MTQTADLIHKMAEFFKSEEFFEKGEDAKLKLSPDDVRCMNEIIKACGNAISRQAVLDLIADYDLSMGQVVKGIHELPPVTPQSEIVRCSQCKYAEVTDSEDSQDGYTCQFHRGSIWFSGSYCSWAERRQDG